MSRTTIVYFASVFLDFHGNKNVSVFESLDDAKAWCETKRLEVVVGDQQNVYPQNEWKVTSDCIHYIQGGGKGAVQIESHKVVPKKE